MKPKYFLFLFLTLTIIHQTSSIATIRYVSKSGTSTYPYTSWKSSADSIQKCINICVDGDTIYVANGIYKENLVINTEISLIGSSMDSTVIDGRGMGYYTLRLLNNIMLTNFNIFGRVNGDGICIYSLSSNFPIISINNCRMSEASAGIVSYGLYSNNNIFTNLWGAVDVAGLPNSINVISNCVISIGNVNSIGINIPGPNNANYYINNNLILFKGLNNSRHGISIGAPKNVYLFNNIVSGFVDNIFIDSPYDTVYIKNNNLIYQYSTSSGPASILSGGNRFIVSNVVLSKNKKGIDASSGTKINYNVFWKNQINSSGVTYGDSNLTVDPMFVKDTIPTADDKYDYHLQAFSPAINKGDPNILDLDGTRSDIGLYGGPFGETYTYQDLAPLAPRNPSAVVDSNNITVKWNGNTEADTSFYKVYRDTVLNFTIDSTKLVSASADTFFVQSNPHIITRFVYKVSCVDNQGNESQTSNELVVNITGIEDYPQLTTDYLLYQNYPNPFNPSTKIGYQLKERAYIKLMVYDIKGELVSVLVNKEQNAGYYEVEFSSSGIQHPVSGIQNLASGIYLYRIEVIGEGKIPVYAEMKKMILIK